MATLAAEEAVEPSRRLRAWDYVALNIYWFALSFLWNSMGPILLPTLVPLLVPESQKGGALGILTALGLLVAIVVQPTAGAWSDTRTTRWGRRKPYIVGGTFADALFLLLMALAPNYAVLLVGYLLLQFSSNIAHGPYQGYIPELVPKAKRGTASGIARFFEIVGIIVTSLATGALVSAGQILLAFLAIIFFLILCMLLTARFVKEEPLKSVSPISRQETTIRSSPPLALLFYSRDFSLWLVSRLLILLGGNLIRNYALYFLQDVLGLPNPAAAVGTLLAIIAVAIAIVVFPAGALSDRWGRKVLTVLSGVLGAIGAFLLVSATTLTQVYIDGAFIGVSIGIFLSVNWAWATDLVPAEESGRFLGISNLATAGSGVVAGMGGYVLDYFNAQTQNSGYPVLFMTAAACYLLGTAMVFAIRDVRRSARVAV